MKKNTWDLYRCHAIMWADLPYKKALLFRIECAKQAMLYYKALADEIDGKFETEEFLDLVDKFTDSSDAVEWNRKFYEEVKDEN